MTVKKAFDAVDRIFNSKIKEAVEARIAEYGSDIKKAQKSLAKQPLFITDPQGKQTEITTVTLLEGHYVIRYKVDSLKYKDLPSIVDQEVKKAIEARFAECDNDDKKFQKSITEETPIVMPGSCMPVKTVRCLTGLKDKSVVAVRKDNQGHTIGYAKPGGNNHVAFYRDSKGKVNPMVVTTWIATKRKRLGIPVIITDPSAAWDYLANLPETDDVKEVALSMPEHDAEFVMDMKMGDMFILGMSDEEFRDAVETNNKAALSAHLYRCLSISPNDYMFIYHIVTKKGESLGRDMAMKSIYRIKSFNSLKALNPQKVNIQNTGKISTYHK